MNARPSTATVEVEPLWSVEDVMARLRCSARTVRRHRREMGARLTAGGLRFRREDVLAYEERQKLTTAEPAPKPRPALRIVAPRAALKHDTPNNPLTGLPWGEYR